MGLSWDSVKFYQLIMSMCEELWKGSKYSLMKWKIMTYFNHCCYNLTFGATSFIH